MVEDKMRLDDELKWFEENRAKLLDLYPGKFVLVRDSKVQSSFDSAQAAYEAGVNIFGVDGFLVKQVLPSDPIERMPAVWVGSLRAAI